MPRKPRFYLPGLSVHVFQRGHNKEPIFFDDEDYLVYLRYLKAAADQFDCAIHAYVLMTNHVHFLLTPQTSNGISLLFQSVGRHYVPYINKRYGRRGSLWEGRYKSCVIGAEDYFLACMRYIECNPVRAGRVEYPVQYRWSSYAANALGVDNAVLKAHSIYTSLDVSAELRRHNYRALFDVPVAGELDMIRSGLYSGTPIGNDKFKQQLELAVGRKVGLAKVGRPKKRTDIIEVRESG
jgi:putative transposase